jgi:hypothetical protein
MIAVTAIIQKPDFFIIPKYCNFVREPHINGKTHHSQFTTDHPPWSVDKLPRSYGASCKLITGNWSLPQPPPSPKKQKVEVNGNNMHIINKL